MSAHHGSAWAHEQDRARGVISEVAREAAQCDAFEVTLLCARDEWVRAVPARPVANGARWVAGQQGALGAGDRRVCSVSQVDATRAISSFGGKPRLSP